MDSSSEVKVRKTIEEIYPNVFLIYGQKRSAHAYFIKGTHKNVLIDSCLPNGVESVTACLASIGITPKDIQLVLLTHEHVDHAGGVPELGCNAIIGAHRLAADKLAIRDEFALMTGALGKLNDEPFHIDLHLATGVIIDLGNYELHVIHTPGHCSGAVCFFEPNHRFLISGDVIMANGIVGGVLQSGNVSDYINSLKLLAGYRIDQLFPGHGKISTNALDDILMGKLRLETLLKESKILFRAVENTEHGFDQIMRSLRDLNQ